MYFFKTGFLCAVVLWQGAAIASFPEVYFSPADNIRNKLITRIKQERESISMAVYLITDQGVIEALGKAKERGVAVEVVADILSFENGWGKAVLLQKYDIPVFVYDGGAQSIMHNKFFIFGSNNGKKLLWTGSYNPTQKADKYNRENVIVVDDQAVVQFYEREFTQLKKYHDAFLTKKKNSLPNFRQPCRSTYNKKQYTGHSGSSECGGYS